MKIPPSGDNFRVPNQPAGPTPTQGSGFDAKIEGAKGAQSAQGAQAAQRGEGPETTKFRQLLEGIDPKSPDAVGAATEKLIDWHLSEQFGPAVLNAKGIDDVRAKVREQILGDPAAESKIRGILNRM